MEITPTGGALGAFITNIDLRETGSPATQSALRAAWLEHLVLVFPDQPLIEPEFLAFAGTLGVPGRYPFVTGLADFPEIIEVKKLAHERNNFGGIWHSDTVYLERPPMASMLVAREIPPAGGDTEFADMYASWEQLSPDLQQLVGPLVAINRSDLADVSKTRADRLADSGTTQPTGHRATFAAEHPAVRTHPETGRKALSVNVAHTSGFVGMTGAESRPILAALFEHQTQARFVWRLEWHVDMLALWDNRCLLHNPINDYDGHNRLMHRITLAGDRPY